MTTKPTPEKPISVMFVCLGNICRSPLADAVLQHHVNSSPTQLKPLFSKIDSCGTGAYHVGSNPDSRSMAVLRKMGLTSYKHSAQQLSPSHFDEFDYILAMDDSNLADIIRVRDRKKPNSKAQISKFGDWLLSEDEGKSKMWKGMEVEDPYYGGDTGFDRTWEVCDKLARGFLKQTCDWSGEEGKL